MLIVADDIALAEAERRYGEKHRLIVMLNNLGGCSTQELAVQELAVLTDEVLTPIGVERIALLVRPAALMTLLDRHAFSITLRPAGDDYLGAAQFRRRCRVARRLPAARSADVRRRWRY